MKKTLVAIFFAALAALFIVLIIRPDLLDRLEQADVTYPTPEPASVEQPGEPTSPTPAAVPEQKGDPQPERPTTAEIQLHQITGRSVYVNGTDQTGHESCLVPPGRTVVVTWDRSGQRFSHELVDARAGETVSPAAALEQAVPLTGIGQSGPGRTGGILAVNRDGAMACFE